MADRPGDFYDRLRDKLGDSASREQDRHFWATFSREFGKRPLISLSAPWRSRQSPHWLWIVPFLALFALAVVLRSCLGRS